MTKLDPTPRDLATLRDLFVQALAEADHWDSVAAAYIAAALDRIPEQTNSG